MAQRIQPIANDPAGNMQSGARIALIGMLVNVVLAAAKVSAGLFGNSYVLIADGIESALDIAGSAGVWGGVEISPPPPRRKQPPRPGQTQTPGGPPLWVGGALGSL